MLSLTHAPRGRIAILIAMLSLRVCVGHAAETFSPSPRCCTLLPQWRSDRRGGT